MQPGYTEIVASPLENSTAVDCIVRHFRDWLIATRIVNTPVLLEPLHAQCSLLFPCVLRILSAIPIRHRFAPTKSWTVSRFHVTVTYRSSHFHLGAVVLNSRKQPATDRNVAALQLSTPGQFERLLDSDEAAALLGIHKKTLQRMARSGEVPGFQIGDLWRFRASTLNEWLGSRLAG